MNTEKQVKMSLKLAKQMLGKDKAMDMLIKQNFSDKELGIKPKLPKTWEGIGELNGYYIDSDSIIMHTKNGLSSTRSNKNVLPTKKLAQAMLALCQLLYLRDIYNDGWQPDWKDGEQKYTIVPQEDAIECFENNTISRSMTFKTSKLRDLFLESFKDLLKIAKPLL